MKLSKLENKIYNRLKNVVGGIFGTVLIISLPPAFHNEIPLLFLHKEIILEKVYCASHSWRIINYHFNFETITICVSKKFTDFTESFFSECSSII